MDEAAMRYRCPECDRAILNRKIDRCLYCGASLPAALLLSPEQIDELNRQQQMLEQQARQTAAQPSPPPQPVADNAGSNWDLGNAVDAIEIASDVIDIAADIAADVISGIGGLLE